jgi:hypothetical protein
LGAARQGGATATPWWLIGGIAASACVAAYQPKGAASLAASYTNLANPGTYNAAPGVAPTWDAVSGWIFNKAAQQYLSTGINPAGTMQQYGLIVRYSEITVGPSQILLGQTLSTTDSICFFNGNNLFRAYSSGYGGALLSTYLDGVLAVFANKLYYNGGEIATINNYTGNVLKSDVIYVGGRVTGHYLGAKIQCAAIYNAPISAAQVAALTAAMAAL